MKKTFRPRRVNHVAILNDHVSGIDADTEHDPPIVGQVIDALGHAALHRAVR